MSQLGKFFFEIAAHQSIHGYRFSSGIFRIDFELAMLDGVPGIGFGFERGDWSDELSSFCITAIGFAFPPTVHKNEFVVFRWSRFNPTMLVAVPSLSQLYSSLSRGVLRRNPLVFDEKITPVRRNSSNSEGRKYHFRPS